MVEVEVVLKKDEKERDGTLAGDFLGFPSVLVPLNKLREAKRKRVTRGWGAAATGACWLDED
jgi:hypothetical protein